MRHYRQRHGFSRWTGTLDELDEHIIRSREKAKRQQEIYLKQSKQGIQIVTPW
jgi:hypothetical protein